MLKIFTHIHISYTEEYYTYSKLYTETIVDRPRNFPKNQKRKKTIQRKYINTIHRPLGKKIILTF